MQHFRIARGKISSTRRRHDAPERTVGRRFVTHVVRSRRYIRGEDGKILHTFIETSGTSQGDPFGPADHNLAVVELMRDLAQSFNCAQLWYLDDGNLVGPVEVLAAFMNSISDPDSPGRAAQ